MHNYKHIILISALIASLIMVFSLMPIANDTKEFHTYEEIQFFNNLIAHGPIDSTLIFPTGKSCEGCHGKDLMENAYIDNEGNDINLYDDWQTSMMANSAKDPFWRAKVSHEVTTFPQHQEETEDKCTSCHAPQGHFTHHVRGGSHYGFSDLLVDTVGLDGVSCGACHQISENNLGEVFSGELLYDTIRTVYGPYEFPFSAPMADFVGFTPKFDPRISDEGLCAGCHTLVTNSLDVDGNRSENFYAEQATYHEWLNSAYSKGEEKQTCQHCHVPQIQDSIVISANYSFLEGRSPFGLHELVGGNVTMLNLIKNNKEALDIDASDENFDETIAATFDMLQNRSLDLDIQVVDQTTDTVFIDVEILNKAGHKFPSGYPSRRAILSLAMITETGDTLFQSGYLDANYEVNGIDSIYEPHHNIISSEEQAQIYEVIVANSDGEVTTLLEQGFMNLKDNRLPPQGFKVSHSTYDTVMISGAALNDSDFNFKNNIEGAGSDVVHFHIPIENYSGNVDIFTQVTYQPLPPRWLAPMFAESTPEIETFKQMFADNDNRPVVMVSDSIPDLFVSSLTLDDIEIADISLYPNPSFDGLFKLESSKKIKSVQIVGANGIEYNLQSSSNSYRLPEATGLYYLKITFKDGTTHSTSIIRK